MALATMCSATVIGVDALRVDVEIDLSFGMPVFQVVGLPDGAVKESRDRVRSALRNSNFELYPHRITVNLAPADIRKEGSAFDLPLALAMLCAQGVIKPEVAQPLVCVGELGLDGSIRPVTGVLPIAIMALNSGFKHILVPKENAPEAAVVAGIKVIACSSLKQVVEWLQDKIEIEPTTSTSTRASKSRDQIGPDFADVRGQEHVKRALEVAAAGGHNALLIGPPGSGKTMLAKRLPTILPRPSFTESLETTKIYSVAGLLGHGTALLNSRPFRSPHHSISDAGLIGGGTYPKPGEVSLSHHGVLFLDELPEFKKHVLEVMRQPLEDGQVTISRATTRITYPANFMLLASMNPCPCGYLGDPNHQCTCTPYAIERYQNKLSGPLLDRIDIHIEVPAIKYRELTDDRCAEDSSIIQQRVETARKIQSNRFEPCLGIHANAHMEAKAIEQYCKLDTSGHQLMESVVDKLGMSARATTRILKVARTIADLDQTPNIEVPHLAEAIQYRTLDRGIQV